MSDKTATITLASVTPDPLYNLTMILNEEVAAQFLPLFSDEIMKGEVNYLPNKMVEYKMNVSPEKADALKQAIANVVGRIIFDGKS